MEEKYFENLSNALQKKFIKKGFAFNSFNEKDDALNFLLNQINENHKITFGGSKSVAEIGILEKLKGYKNFIDRNNKEIKLKSEIEAFTSDIYLCSANAITKNGDIIAIDGSGNRVSAMIYGPKKVFIIVGKNKVCNDEQDALKRAKNIAASHNSIRFNLDNPCATNDMICNENCEIEKRMCAYTVIINKSHIKNRLHIIFINENLGY